MIFLQMGAMSLCRTPYSIRDTLLHQATTRQRWRVVRTLTTP
jgi:hypothetical protein